MVQDDPLFASEEEDDSPDGAAPAPWTVLVADDDPQVHAMTAVLLRDFEFERRPFAVVSAYSAGEAAAVLAARPDIPVMLLDVVMETNDAGLRLVRRIREEMENRSLRIILRTGQPGEAPERDVVVTYDINDYKAKSELTAQKLFTSLVGALRAWRDLLAVERSRQGLQSILEASDVLLASRSLDSLVHGMVARLPRVVHHAGAAVLACRDATAPGGGGPAAVAGSGRFAALAGRDIEGTLDNAGVAAIATGFATGESAYGRDRCVLVLRTIAHGTTVFLMERPEPFDESDHGLLRLFCERIALGIDHACLYDDLLTLNRTLESRVEARTAELAASRSALAAAKDRAEAALAREMEARQQQRQFTAMVSHEFRTPLAVIDSAAQMLALRARNAAPDMLDRLTLVRTSVHRLTGIIETYLTDERLMSGSLTLDRNTVDLADALRTMVGHLRIAHPDHAFALHLDPAPLRVGADAHLLELALANLMGNAVKYSANDPRVAVEARHGNATVVIEVRDHGCGIPGGEQPHVFARFFRGSNTTGVTGTGIGLHTVKQIVELHGGTVALTSAEGAGTTVRVVLPATGEEP